MSKLFAVLLATSVFSMQACDDGEKALRSLSEMILSLGFPKTGGDQVGKTVFFKLEGYYRVPIGINELHVGFSQELPSDSRYFLRTTATVGCQPQKCTANISALSRTIVGEEAKKYHALLDEIYEKLPLKEKIEGGVCSKAGAFVLPTMQDTEETKKS